MTGRADFFSLGDWNAVCYECGRKRKASTLKKHWQGYYVCPEHWEARQPQDFVRSIPDVMTPPWTQPMPGTGVIPPIEPGTGLITENSNPFIGVYTNITSETFQILVVED
jgi:hypothetical protein